MRKWMKATRAGLKHFFGAGESISRQKNPDRQFNMSDARVKKSRVLSVMGIYVIHLDRFENGLDIEAVHCINF